MIDQVRESEPLIRVATTSNTPCLRHGTIEARGNAEINFYVGGINWHSAASGLALVVQKLDSSIHLLSQFGSDHQTVIVIYPMYSLWTTEVWTFEVAWFEAFLDIQFVSSLGRFAKHSRSLRITWWYNQVSWAFSKSMNKETIQLLSK